MLGTLGMPGRPSRIGRASRATAHRPPRPGVSARGAPAHRARPPTAARRVVWPVRGGPSERPSDAVEWTRAIADEAFFPIPAPPPTNPRHRRARRGRGDYRPPFVAPATEPMNQETRQRSNRHGQHCRVAPRGVLRQYQGSELAPAALPRPAPAGLAPQKRNASPEATCRRPARHHHRATLTGTLCRCKGAAWRARRTTSTVCPARGVAVLHESSFYDRLPVGASVIYAAAAHGANKHPLRLIARLIETSPAPASSSSTRSRASGAGSWERRSPAARGGRSLASSTHAGRPCSHETVAALMAEHDGAGPRLGGPRHGPTGRPARLRPIRMPSREGATLERVLPSLAADVDRALSPPTPGRCNVQLPMTMAGGKLAATAPPTARTDYAMRSDLPEDLANLADCLALSRPR